MATDEATPAHPQAEKLWETLFPCGALLSTKDVPKGGHVLYTEPEFALAVNAHGEPVPLPGETVLGRWTLGAGNRTDSLACLVDGAWVTPDGGLARGVIACGRVRVLVLSHGLRCAISAVDGQLMRAKRLESVGAKQAYAFWLPFAEAERIAASKAKCVLGFNQTIIGAGDINTSDERWLGTQWRSQASPFAEAVVRGVAAWKLASTDPAVQSAGDRITRTLRAEMFAGRRDVEIDLT